jgi:hypothetical protein
VLLEVGLLDEIIDPEELLEYTLDEELLSTELVEDRTIVEALELEELLNTELLKEGPIQELVDEVETFELNELVVLVLTVVQAERGTSFLKP